MSGFTAAMTLFSSVFAATTVASAAPVQTSIGGIGIRLITAPSGSSADSTTPTYIVERLAPGSRVTRQVQISNTTNATADIVVYSAAASYVEGNFSFAPGRTEDSLSSWTSVARPELLLAPGATAFDAVTINIPKRASSGERYAVVWAEVSAPSPTQSGIHLVNRVGIRMFVSVGNGGVPTVDFTVAPLVASRSSNRDPLISSKVHNLGQSAIDVTGKLTLSQGPGGLSAGPFLAKLQTLLAPGHSEIALVQLSEQIPRGPWRADLILSSNGTQRRSSSTIIFPERIPVIQNRRPVTPLVLATLIVIILLLSVGTSVLITRRRRLRLGVPATFGLGDDTR
jgi:hypothetical protein